MDQRKYWERVREEQAGLPDAPWHYLISLGDDSGGKAGVVTPMESRTAARNIVEHRFRLATDEEIAEFQAEQERIAQANRALELQRLKYDLLVRPAVPLPKANK